MLVFFSGINDYGQCNVPIGLSGAIQVTAGGYHSCALLMDGTVTCWGGCWLRDSSCMLACGAWLVCGLSKLGYQCAHCMLVDAARPCAGSNYYGEGAVPAGLSNIVQIAAGGDHTCALKTDRTVVCWGAAAPACQALLVSCVTQMSGAGDTCQRPLGAVAECWRVHMHAGHPAATVVPTSLSGIVQIMAGSFHTCALRSNGTVACWGACCLHLCLIQQQRVGSRVVWAEMPPSSSSGLC